jgi:hypothetical protein
MQPPGTSQRMTLRSSPPVARVLPSAEKTAHNGRSEWPINSSRRGRSPSGDSAGPRGSQVMRQHASHACEGLDRRGLSGDEAFRRSPPISQRVYRNRSEASAVPAPATPGRSLKKVTASPLSRGGRYPLGGIRGVPRQMDVGAGSGCGCPGGGSGRSVRSMLYRTPCSTFNSIVCGSWPSA